MPIPGLTDTYAFVDWLKARKYHIEHGEGIQIRGELGGLITVRLHRADLEADRRFEEKCKTQDALNDALDNSPEVIEKLFKN